MLQSALSKPSSLSKPFWVIWGVELWERFGYYGVQAILALYFVQQLGYSESQSFYVFGSFAAFVYGFNWLGGYIGDYYLGSKRTLALGAIILMLSYAGLALASHKTVFYALAAVVVGNALFKANPSSLISKMYAKGDPALDGAITMYYMAVNVGSLFSMWLTPIISVKYGWSYAYWFCSFGLLLGLLNYFIFKRILKNIDSKIGHEPMKLGRLLIVIAGSIVAIFLIAQLLPHTALCTGMVYLVSSLALLYFLKIAFSLKGVERKRMLIAFILILQGVIFFVLYNQMPTSLTFFAVHNVNKYFLGLNILPAQYQDLNPLVIVIMSPILAWFYKKVKTTHATKFCLGMTLCSSAFIVLYIAKFSAVNGIISSWWMVATYYFQSVGELLISALGLAMVAELCPAERSGFVMGVWLLTSMLAGPISAWVGALTAPPNINIITPEQSLDIYAHVFLEIGVVTGVISLVMWSIRPILNRYIAEP